MEYVFSHLDSFKQALSHRPFGLFSDVDGTLSEIAPTPVQAIVSPEIRGCLLELTRRLELVAVVSGRDVLGLRRLVDAPGVIYVGGHGLERWENGRAAFAPGLEKYPEIIRTLIREVSPQLPKEGIIIEDKGVTASFHYRLAPEPEAAEKAIVAAIESAPSAAGLQIRKNRKIIEVMPPVTLNKGTAVSELIEKRGLRGAIYIGDDTTDIDAFRTLRTARERDGIAGLAIGVMSREMPPGLTGEVDFSLNGVPEVVIFLRWLSEAAAVL